MQIVYGDKLHEMPKPVFWEKYFKMLSVETFAQHSEH